MKRAFTLIELLVVVAILFPVFAQAKKTAGRCGSGSALTLPAPAPARPSGSHIDQGAARPKALDVPVAPGPVGIRIEGDPKACVLGFRDAEGREGAAGELDARHLSTELAGGFTGVVIGLLATGNGQPATNYADFKWFDYRETSTTPGGGVHLPGWA